MKSQKFRFSASHSAHDLKQHISLTQHDPSSTHFKTEEKTSSSMKIKKTKGRRKSNPANNRSKLLKSFNYTNPVEQLQTISSDICSLKLTNQILKAKVINQNVRKSKEKLTTLGESFLSEQRETDCYDMVRKIEELDKKICETQILNNAQQMSIGRIKEEIGVLIEENKKLKVKTKLKLNPSHALDVLLKKLRD